MSLLPFYNARLRDELFAMRAEDKRGIARSGGVNDCPMLFSARYVSDCAPFQITG